MKAFFAVLDNGLLKPMDEDTRIYINRREPGTVISADIKQARNYEQHKRFFSFLETTFDMQDHFTEPEAYRKWITMKSGYFDTIVTPKGDTLFVAQSISFEAMDEDIFKKLFDTAIDVFIRELGKGLTDQELLRAIDYG